MAHSPGPWTIEDTPDWYNIRAPGWLQVASCESGDNARLVAAAPEMLVALKKMLDHLCSDADLDYPQHLKLTSYLRDLIARAEK